MEVDVEKGDRGRSPYPVKDGLRSDQEAPGAVGNARSAPDPAPAPSRARHLAHGDPQQRLELLPDPAHSRAQRLGAQPAAGGTDDGPRLSAARASQHIFVTVTPCAAPQRAQRVSSPHCRAGEQARATRAVVDTDEGGRSSGAFGAPATVRTPRLPPPSVCSSTARARRTNSSEKRPVRGSAPLRSTRSREAQPWRSPGPDDDRTVAGGSVTGGTGDTSRHAAPSRRARSTTTSTAL